MPPSGRAGFAGSAVCAAGLTRVKSRRRRERSRGRDSPPDPRLGRLPPRRGLALPRAPALLRLAEYSHPLQANRRRDRVGCPPAAASDGRDDALLQLLREAGRRAGAAVLPRRPRSVDVLRQLGDAVLGEPRRERESLEQGLLPATHGPDRVGAREPRRLRDRLRHPRRDARGVRPRAAADIPGLLLLALVTALGIGFWLSALNVSYRDVQYVVPFLIQIGLFASIFASNVHREPWHTILGLNPMAGVVEGFRWALVRSGHGLGPLVAVSCGVAVFLLVSGAAYFRSVERSFADVV